MKVFGAVVLCLAVVAAQPVDDDNLVKRAFSGPSSAPVTGREEVIPHSRPSQVGIYYTSDKGISELCGGSLISPEWVLTSARCLVEYGVDTWQVVLGAHDITNPNEATQVRVSATNATVHPDYNDQGLNDVGLLRLPEPVTLTPAIQPIRLPSRSQIGNNLNGTKAFELYWSVQSSDANSSVEQYLQVANKTVVSVQTCNDYYFIFYGPFDPSKIICTFDDGEVKSTCNGDYGDPLIIQEDDGEDTQIGIFSFSLVIECNSGWPAVYVQLPQYVDFISEVTGIKIRP